MLLSSVKRPKTLGIVLDCDPDESGTSGVARRWDQITYRLRGLPYALPSAPDSGGTIIEGSVGYPRVGVWLMPDNEADGIFEDFVLRLIPASALTFARDTARTAKVLGYGSYKDVHESKAVAYSYLAWQDEPGKPFGIAIRAGSFNLESLIASAFVGWLRDLFQQAD